MSLTRTFDPTDVKINLNGLALTDIRDQVSVEESGDVWDEEEGLNGDVERIRHVRKLARVTINFQQTSPQLALIEGFQLADEKTKAGPFAFAMSNLGGSFSLVGQAWIKSNRNASFGNALNTRAVVISVKKDAGFAGA
jgi:hypothetical protein